MNSNMNISAMIETLIDEAIEAGDARALDYISDRIQAAIDQMEDGPAFATDDWAKAKRDELRLAIEAARSEIAAQ